MFKLKKHKKIIYYPGYYFMYLKNGRVFKITYIDANSIFYAWTIEKESNRLMSGEIDTHYMSIKEFEEKIAENTYELFKSAIDFTIQYPDFSISEKLLTYVQIQEKL